MGSPSFAGPSFAGLLLNGLLFAGPLGGAAIGLHALLAGRAEGFAPFVARWRGPAARVDLAPEVAACCSAAIDLSDGFAQDVQHLARASGVAIEVALDQLPTLPGHADAAVQLGLDALAIALSGGEDYELCATAREGLSASRWTEVGTVVEGEGLWVVAGGVRSRWTHGGGWDHFSEAGVTSRRRAPPRT